MNSLLQEMINGGIEIYNDGLTFTGDEFVKRGKETIGNWSTNPDPMSDEEWVCDMHDREPVYFNTKEQMFNWIVRKYGDTRRK